MSKTKDKKILLLISIALFVVSIFSYIYIRYDINNEIENILVRQKKELSSDNRFDTDITKVKKIYDETKIERDNVKSLITDQDNTFRFIEYLEGLEKQLNVSVSKGNPSVLGIEENGEYSEVGFHISVQGKWDDVMRYMKLIESVPNNITRISGFNIAMTSSQVTKDKKSINIWTSNFDIRLLIRNTK